MKRIALLSIMMLIALCSQAQIYSSEACFYLEAGKSITDKRESNWKIVKFKGNKLFTTSTSLSKIDAELRRNPNYYEGKGLDGCSELTYNSSLSTSSEYVYSGSTWAYTMEDPIYGYINPSTFYYKAVFNKDNSTLKWYLKDEKDSDYKVWYFVRVPKSEVLPVSNGFIE